MQETRHVLIVFVYSITALYHTIVQLVFNKFSYIVVLIRYIYVYHDFMSDKLLLQIKIIPGKRRMERS